MPGVVPVLHAGPGCAGNFAWTANGASGLQVTGQCLGLSVPATNLQENEVVFGGTDRLREELLETARIMEGDTLFVLTGCLPEVIGDDARSLADELSTPERPVLFASVPGFSGDSYAGYGEVLKSIAADGVRRLRTKRDLANVWGVPPGLDPFWRGNLEGIRGLLALLGIRANLLFGPASDPKALRRAGAAAANIVVSGLYGAEAAGIFRDLHGIPSVPAPLPYGAAASERFLKAAGRAFGLPPSRMRRAIQTAGRAHYAALEPAVDLLNDMESQRHAAVIGDANHAPALSAFISEELGWVPELTVIVNDLDARGREALEGYWEATGTPRPANLVYASDRRSILEAARGVWPEAPQEGYRDPKRPAIVLGSSLDRALASAIGAGHLSVSYPVANRLVLTRGYTGYRGGLALTEDLVSACIGGR
jgi:nitrogenase molybdenum-iron protein beta chain